MYELPAMLKVPLCRLLLKFLRTTRSSNSSYASNRASVVDCNVEQLGSLSAKHFETRGSRRRRGPSIAGTRTTQKGIASGLSEV